MNLPRAANLARVGLCLACLVLVACNQSVPKLPPAAARQARLDWNQKTLGEAYQKIGFTDSAWDEPARRALDEFARTRAHALEPDEDWATIVRTNCAAAVKAGCDDPQVRYLYIRFAVSQTNSPKYFLDAFEDMESAMKTSHYSSLRKFYATLRTEQQYTYTYGYGRDVDFTKPRQWLADALANLVVSLNDRTLPPEEAYDACTALLYQWPGDMASFENCCQQIEKPLFANWPNEAMAWLVKGQAYNIKGSMARGTGYANTVTEAGWKALAENKAAAEKCLERAWQLDPKDARIAVAMIWVKTGQDQGRDRMELWFSRAMEDDPDDYDACNAKLNYLEPKWYGSAKAMLEFGRECVQNTNWGGTVPLILVDAHYRICNQYTDKSDQTLYWQQPGVWADIRSAYERYLPSHPGDTSRIAYYAWYACQAEQWDKLNELLPRLAAAREDAEDAFGGRDKLDEAVQLAQHHARETNASQNK